MEKQITTRNHIDVFSNANPHLHQTELCVYLRYGSMFEPPEYNGLAHFFEHILYRNLNKIYNGEFFRLLDLNCITFGASAYKEMIILQISFLPSKTDFVLDFFEKIFSEIVLTADEISMERKRIRAEIREHSQWELDEQADKAVWGNTSLSKKVIGTCSSIAKIRKKQLTAVRREIFSERNFFVYITGFVGKAFPEKVAKILEKQSFDCVPFRDNLAPIPQNFGRRDCAFSISRSDCPRMKLCFDMDCTRITKPERDILFSALFKGDFGKFYQNLSEKSGLVYSHTATQEEYINIGNLKVFLEYSKNDFLPLLREIVLIFQDMKRGNFDLECARAYDVYGKDILLDEPENLGWTCAYDIKMLNSPFNFENLAETYRAVTKERISALASEIFTTKNLTAVFKGNMTEKDYASAREILAELDK